MEASRQPRWRSSEHFMFGSRVGFRDRQIERRCFRLDQMQDGELANTAFMLMD